MSDDTAVLPVIAEPCMDCAILLGKSIGDARPTTFAEMRNTAERGCPICDDLVSTISRLYSRQDIEEAENFEHHKSLVEWNNPIYSSGVRVKFYGPNLTRSGLYSIVGYFAIRNHASLRDIPLTLSPSTHSEMCRARVASWMRRCDEGHRECVSHMRQPRWYPTRLLEICDGGRVRLIETAGKTLLGGYACLSHCWGKDRIITLTTKTSLSLTQGVATCELPKTFRHAIEITAGWVSLRYIWIDSLCIYQDSVDDWNREGLKMRDVYRQAYVTIAARAARNATDGLFFERSVADIRLVKCNFLPGADHSYFDLVYLIRNYKDLKGLHPGPKPLEIQPLSHRAWAFQERLLSPRIIHFGRPEIMWECKQTAASELFPWELPELYQQLLNAADLEDWTHNSSLPRGPLQDFSLFESPRWDKIVWIRWAHILESYMGAELTRDTDRVIAFAGVVTEIEFRSQRRSCMDYYAGLWSDVSFATVPAQLLWVPVPIESSALTRRPKQKRAPTWSPFSMEGPIRLFSQLFNTIPDNQFQHALLNVLDISTRSDEVQSSATLYFQSCVHVRGILSPLDISQMAIDGQVTVSQINHRGLDHMNLMLRQDEVGGVSGRHEIFLLPVLSSVYRTETLQGWMHVPAVIGLILTSTGEESEYQRCGFWVAQPDSEWYGNTEDFLSSNVLGRRFMQRRRKSGAFPEDWRGQIAPGLERKALILEDDEWEDVTPDEFRLI